MVRQRWDQLSSVPSFLALALEQQNANDLSLVPKLHQLYGLETGKSPLRPPRESNAASARDMVGATDARLHSRSSSGEHENKIGHFCFGESESIFTMMAARPT